MLADVMAGQAVATGRIVESAPPGETGRSQRGRGRPPGRSGTSRGDGSAARSRGRGRQVGAVVAGAETEPSPRRSRGRGRPARPVMMSTQEVAALQDRVNDGGGEPPDLLSPRAQAIRLARQRPFHFTQWRAGRGVVGRGERVESVMPLQGVPAVRPEIGTGPAFLALEAGADRSRCRAAETAEPATRAFVGSSQGSDFFFPRDGLARSL